MVGLRFGPPLSLKTEAPAFPSPRNARRNMLGAFICRVFSKIDPAILRKVQMSVNTLPVIGYKWLIYLAKVKDISREEFNEYQDRKLKEFVGGRAHCCWQDSYNLLHALDRLEAT